MGKILSRLAQSMDQRVGVKQDHRKGEPAQITTYHKIPKISPGRDLYFSKALFEGLFLEGLIYEGNLPFFLCFTLYLRAISKNKPPLPGGGGGNLEERLNRRFFVLWVWGAYNWRGLYMYVEGLIFRILRYMPTLLGMALISCSLERATKSPG